MKALRAGITLAAGLALGALGLAATLKSEPTDPPAPASAEPSPELARCRFTSGATAAFAFDSRATPDDPEDGRADVFRGLLSWVVVDEGDGDHPALLRSSLASVTLEQALSEERVSAAELEGRPFFVRVDARCRFTALGFAPSWSAASRRLVATLLGSYEIVLPDDGSSRWEAEQRDGVGAYTAAYRMLGGARIVRTKPRYRLDDAAARMGLRVQVLGARAEARFDPSRPGWMQRVEGRERIRFHIAGREPQGFVHRFRIARADERYLAVRGSLSPDEADFADAFAASEPPTASDDPSLAALDHGAARTRFLDALREGGRSAIYPAARFLASWLRAHPDESALLLADLREGAIDPAAHSALFLALELAGTDASREVLAEALVDPQLAEIDRARAASALADHGQPTRASADLLLAQADDPRSPMVANVSLLGVGSMAGRTEPGDPLRGELRAALDDELARATGEPAEIAVVDALGNSGDNAFEPALTARLDAERPTLRAHAAEALGHLSPELARPALVARLEHEESARVSTAILRSLSRMEGAELTEAERALAARKLATSSSVEERGAVIEWLGRADQDEARQVLAAHFAEEPDVHLQQRIGAFVPASELR